MLVRILILCVVPIAAFHQNVFPDPFRIFDNIGSIVRNLPRGNFKTINLSNIPPGTKKVINDGNGQGVVFRSPTGNSAGFTFTSGNGGAAGGSSGFAFGGGAGGGFGPNEGGGDWVFSSSSSGRPGKVVFGKGRPPFFRTGPFFGKDSFIDNFFKFFKKFSV